MRINKLTKGIKAIATSLAIALSIISCKEYYRDYEYICVNDTDELIVLTTTNTETKAERVDSLRSGERVRVAVRHDVSGKDVWDIERASQIYMFSKIEGRMGNLASDSLRLRSKWSGPEEVNDNGIYTLHIYKWLFNKIAVIPEYSYLCVNDASGWIQLKTTNAETNVERIDTLWPREFAFVAVRPDSSGQSTWDIENGSQMSVFSNMYGVLDTKYQSDDLTSRSLWSGLIDTLDRERVYVLHLTDEMFDVPERTYIYSVKNLSETHSLHITFRNNGEVKTEDIAPVSSVWICGTSAKSLELDLYKNGTKDRLVGVEIMNMSLVNGDDIIPIENIDANNPALWTFSIESNEYVSEFGVYSLEINQ